MDILSALETLRNASTKDLQNHKIEATAAFREIEARLGGFEYRHQEAVEDASCVQLRSCVDQPALSGEVAKPTNPTKLLAALNKTSDWVRLSIKLEPRKALNIEPQLVCDRRLADVRRVEGDFNAKNQYKFLRGLAQRSLALQGEESGHLDIEHFCKVASSRGTVRAKQGRRGKIASYVKDQLGIEGREKTFAIRAVQAGIRQLVMERLLRRRFEETEQCDTGLKQHYSSGISALTALAVRPFRYLKYEEIPEFLDHLLDPDSVNLAGSENEQIADFINEISIWYDKLQIYYNKELVGIDADLDAGSSINDYTPSSSNDTSRFSDQPTTPGKVAEKSGVISPQYICTSSEDAPDSSNELSDASELSYPGPGIRTADDKDASNNVAIPDRYCSASSTDLASSKPSGTVPCSVSTEETDKVHRKRRRLSSHTDSIWYNGSHPSKNNQLQTEFHRTNPARQSPAPLTTQRELSSPQNVMDTYFHSCEPQLDNVHFGGIASDHERSIFNPMSSDAVFSLFSDHQLDNVQLDSTPADEGRTIFNPMSSEAVFSLLSDHQLNNVQLDNIQPGNIQPDNLQPDNLQLDSTPADEGRTIFNPMSSEAVFSLLSDHQLNNVQLGNVQFEFDNVRFDNMQLDNVQLDSTPADEGRTIFNPMSSEAVFSLSSDHQLNNVQPDNLQLNHVQPDSTTADQRRTIFNPMSSEAVFSLSSDHQLDNVQPDNLQLNHVQLDSTTADQRRTIFNPRSSNAGFSLFSDRHLDGAQLNRVAETDQGNICDRQAPSHSFCSPFSNSPLYHTTAKIGFNSTEFNRARSEVL